MAVSPQTLGSKAQKFKDFVPSPFHQAVYAQLSKRSKHGITCESIWCDECGRERYGIGYKQENGEVVKDYLCMTCRIPE